MNDARDSEITIRGYQIAQKWCPGNGTLAAEISTAIEVFVARERERVIAVVDKMCGSHTLTKRLKDRLEGEPT